MFMRKIISDKLCNKIVEIDTCNITDISNLNDLVLRNANFENLNLEGWSLDNTYCMNSNFYNADLYGAFLAYCDFSNCDLRNADLRGICADRTIFWKSDLRGTNFSINNLGGANYFNNCDFSDMNWDKNTKFTGAFYDQYTIFPKTFIPEEYGMQLKISSEKPLFPNSFENLIYRYGNFQKQDFSNHSLGHAILVYSNFAEASLENSNCFSTDFSYADLRNCSFRNASLIRTIFYHADMRGVDFSGGNNAAPADLSDADLRQIIYDRTTKFSGAFYSSRTYFPEGFEPQKYGMKIVDSVFDNLWK